MDSRADLFAAYASTVVTTTNPESLERVSAEEACRTRQLGAVVITAWNPGFERPARESNGAANERLLDDIAATGLTCWDARGESPDGEFHEDGFLVWGMAVSEGIRLGVKYGQFAVFVYRADGGRVLVECVAA